MTVRLSDAGKAYNGVWVFRHLHLTFEDGGTYCLMAPSGAGKTTLLRLLMGLEHPDEGIVEGADRSAVSAVFQEDRLCPGLGAEKNILLVNPVCSGAALTEEIIRLLPADSLAQPVSEYSGGMRRRVSLLRAMLHPGSLILMDEPFNGLDAATRDAAIRYVKEKQQGRTLIFATHHQEEARAMGATNVNLCGE